MPAIVDAMLGERPARPCRLAEALARGERRRGGRRPARRRSPSCAAWPSTGASSDSTSRSRAGEIVGLAGRRGRRPPRRCSSSSAGCGGPTRGTRRAARRPRRCRAGCAARSARGVALVHRRPPPARADARQADLGEHRRRSARSGWRPTGRSCARGALRRAGARAGRRALRIRTPLGRSAGGLAVGRQPAEGRVRQVAGRGSRRWSCSTTRRAASTSAPRPRCTR